MHPFVQAIIAVFVGLVVLGPAEVELPPEALAAAPAKLADETGPVGAQPVEVLPTQRPVPAPHVVYVSQDSPAPLSQTAQARMTVRIGLRLGLAPAPLPTAGPDAGPALAALATVPAPRTAPGRTEPAKIAASMSLPGRLSTQRNTAQVQLRPGNLSQSPAPAAHHITALQPPLQDLGSPERAPNLFRPTVLFPIGPADQQRITALSEPPSPYSPRLINAEFVHLRSGPSASAQIISQLNVGDWVLFAGVTNGNWSQVLSPDGQEVWVYTEYLSLPDDPTD